MSSKIAVSILMFIAAIFSALFWIEAQKIGDVFLSQTGAVFRSSNEMPEAEKNNIIKNQNASVGGAQEKIIEPDAAAQSSAVPEILAPSQKIVAVPVIKLPELTQSQVDGDGALTRAGIINETNRWRQINLGTGFALKENSYLNIAAAGKVKDMFDGQYFDHISPAKLGVAHFVDLAGYEYIVIGENLAKGGYDSDADVVQAWMDSPGHRENILKSGYKEIGAAAAYGMFGGKNTWLAVQIFAIPESACPRVDGNLAAQIESDKAALDKSDAGLEILLADINQKKSPAKSAQEYATVNENVKNYNAKIKQVKILYDSYKEKINQYNSQVTAYNACLAAL